MTSADTPRGRIDAVQTLLDAVVADTARLADLVDHLEASAGRAQSLEDYLTGDWLEDRDVVVADLGTAVGPPVLGEDPAWEAVAERHDLVRRLLRIVTAELTRGLDTER